MCVEQERREERRMDGEKVGRVKVCVEQEVGCGVENDSVE